MKDTDSDSRYSDAYTAKGSFSFKPGLTQKDINSLKPSISDKSQVMGRSVSVKIKKNEDQ
jgi:hypothetical protein